MSCWMKERVPRKIGRDATGKPPSLGEPLSCGRDKKRLTLHDASPRELDHVKAVVLCEHEECEPGVLKLVLFGVDTRIAWITPNRLSASALPRTGGERAR